MKTILHWAVYAYNMADMYYRPTNEVTISVIAVDENEAIEKAKKYFQRKFYTITHVQEIQAKE
jgi:TPR repeat protein